MSLLSLMCTASDQIQLARERLEVAVITGPCGVGKTALVNRCARELGLSVHFFHPADLANQEIITSRVIPALLCPGFTGSCVVFDDLVPAQLLESIQQKVVGLLNPLIITQEPAKVKLPKGVKHLTIHLQRLAPCQLRLVAKEFSPRALDVEYLVERCQGDARRLINSLQFGIFDEPQAEEDDQEEEIPDFILANPSFSVGLSLTGLYCCAVGG